MGRGGARGNREGRLRFNNVADDSFDSLILLEQAAEQARAQLVELQERFASQGEEGLRVPPGEWSEEQHAEYNALWKAWRDAATAFHAALAGTEDRLKTEMAVKKAVRHPEPTETDAA